MSENIKPKVYLAGAINACTVEECRDWREEVKTKLGDVVEYLDPMVRDYRGVELEPGMAAEIVELDKKDVSQADIILVHYEKPSVGTAMEILFAFNLGIYIILIDKTGSPLSPWLLYHATDIVGSIDQAVEKIKKVAEQFTIYEVQTWEDDGGV